MYHLNKYDLNFVLHKFGYLDNITSRRSSHFTSLDTTQQQGSSVMNNTSSTKNFLQTTNFQPTSMQVLCVVLLSCIFFVGVFGNFLVIYIFGLKPGKGNQTKRFETFLIILGIVDLVSSFIIPSTFIYLTLTNYQRWDFGYVGCKVIPPLLQISISISQGVLILISYERYQTIVHPFERRLTTGKIYVWLIVAFLVSIILAIPYAMTLDLVDAPNFNVKTCLPRNDSQSLQLLSSCIYLCRDVLSVAAMFCLYFRMNRHLTKDYVMATWDRPSFSRKGRQLLRTVVIVFVVLTLPFDIFQVSTLSVFVTDDNETITASIYENLVLVNTLLQILQIANSVANIFIYSKLHLNFRRQFIGYCRQKNDDDYSMTRRSTITITDSYRVSVRFPDMADETDFSSCVTL